ncbi:MAG: cytochrome c oxidase subunit II [Anaerolineales bacterium]|nr:cytochrome c oxidase subunit II [Anaerolineales bacterium]
MHVHPSEKRYFIFTVILMGIFAAALAVGSIAYGVQLPVPYQLVDPTTIKAEGGTSGLPFDLPEAERVREIAPGQYEAYVHAYAWGFSPKEIRVPAGSRVTFFVTSRDVIHGFKIQETNLNMMVIPGQVSRLSHTFNQTGTYNFICHEYCGIAHHGMFGQVIVE